MTVVRYRTAVKGMFLRVFIDPCSGRDFCFTDGATCDVCDDVAAGLLRDYPDSFEVVAEKGVPPPAKNKAAPAPERNR